MKISQMKNLKVNYHLLEACNFGCKFCFARYAQKSFLSFEHMKKVVEKKTGYEPIKGIRFACRNKKEESHNRQQADPLLKKRKISALRFAKSIMRLPCFVK